MTAAADAKEKAAFQKVKALLPKSCEVLTEPRGSDAGWPDFGFRLPVGGKTVDILIEYKADATAQMGSMRDWKFDGRTFTANTTDENKEMLLYLMNESRDCVEKGKLLLKTFQKVVHPQIKTIYSGMLTIESDKTKRFNSLKLFESVASTKINSNNIGYNLATIVSTQLGQKIIDHYIKKFHKAKSSKAHHTIMLFMFDNDLFFVHEEGTLNVKEKEIVAQLFGAQRLPVLNNINAQLEVRIQPRGLSGGPKAASIDVMASLRLKSKVQGHKI